MNNSVLEEAKKIARQSEFVSLGQEEDCLAKAQEILINYLNDYKQDTQAWLLLTRIECNSPFYDPYRIIDYVSHVLSYDPSNAYALLFWSYADYFLMGSSDDNFYDKLCMAHNENPEIMAMIELAKARCLEDRNIKQCEEALKKSIEYAPNFVTNFCMLGKLYIEQKKIKEGVFLVEQGLANIKRIATAEGPCMYDPASIDGLLEEFFAGTTMSIVVYEQFQILLRNNDLVQEV